MNSELQLSLYHDIVGIQDEVLPFRQPQLIAVQTKNFGVRLIRPLQFLAKTLFLSHYFKINIYRLSLSLTITYCIHNLTVRTVGITFEKCLVDVASSNYVRCSTRTHAVTKSIHFRIIHPLNLWHILFLGTLRVGVFLPATGLIQVFAMNQCPKQSGVANGQAIDSLVLIPYCKVQLSCTQHRIYLSHSMVYSYQLEFLFFFRDF